MVLNYSEVKKLIINNDHEKALNNIEIFASQFAPSYINEITVHQTKLNSLNQDNMIGILSRDEYNQGISKLTIAILDLIDRIKTIDSASNENLTSIQSNSINIAELYELVYKLYPKGLQDNRIWERSGGDISYFSQFSNPKEQWWDALQKLKNGGGGNITFESLKTEITKDFPNLM